MRRGFHLALLALQCLCSAVDATTTRTITLTTTIHATSGYRGECDHFTGACVVYGTSAGAAYTTTVYGPPPPPPPPPPPTSVTRTVVVYATTTASDSAACSDYVGACVVYGSGSAGSTVYYATATHNGNGQGYIGNHRGDPDVPNDAAVVSYLWAVALGLPVFVFVIAGMM